jgi:glycerol-3-phosphate dehydrogenase
MVTQQPTMFDMLVIGGGVNGAGIAADAAGRGLSVMLCEQNDLASATSSASSKLIHGGLRYLEHYEFRLVKEALAEREVLLAKAPHIMKPLRFRLPHQKHLRPWWMIRAGLFLYDHLAKRVTLKGSNGVKFTSNDPLKPEIVRGFEYSDGWVDDSRLVVLNAVAAQQHGATICTQTQVVDAKRHSDHWQITVLDKLNQSTKQVQAKLLVNAAGPWVARCFSEALHIPSPENIRLVKGSHIIVPKIHDQPYAFMLQNSDQRIVFVLPFEDDYSLIGTTDVDYQGDPQAVAISQAEIDYLIKITNQYFKTNIDASMIIDTFSGVRPLLDDESSDAHAVTRDYKLVFEQPNDKAPILSVFGGKITTYRKLAEAALKTIAPVFPSMKPAWTAKTPLPGGDFTNKQQLTSELTRLYPWLDQVIIKRYVRSYGTLCFKLLESVNSEQDLGQHFGEGLYQKEVDYLVQYEWAKFSDDILKRRTKMGLRLTPAQKLQLEEYLQLKQAA